ncbi:hypothetical protein [Dyadobacter sp. 3J3]|uniref:hypothetical protein n=1 Tax=Dyadobacter sp. 3J3 TaxID=2606600 RepID=UPI001358E5AB|nr:hypothetical protein [Dyadobacter sp. 3J3]
MPLLKDPLRKRSYFLVVQRFNWPGVAASKGFMVTPYQQQKPSLTHAQTLDAKQGRMLDLRAEIEKITKLIDDPRYFLFLNTFRDADWKSKVLNHYHRNIEANVKMHAPLDALEEISIELTFDKGELKAIIQMQESIREFNLCDLIK